MLYLLLLLIAKLDYHSFNHSSSDCLVITHRSYVGILACNAIRKEGIATRRRPFRAFLLNAPLDLLGSSLLGVLLQRMCRVWAQAVLGVVASLLSALLGASTLLVDVVGCLAGLCFVLALGLGGLTAGVGGRHCGLLWVLRFLEEVCRCSCNL